MAKVLVTGATGLLGCALIPMLVAKGHRVVRLGHTNAADVNADLTLCTETAAILDCVQPDVIINLVALTHVDTCETAVDQAYRLNVLVVENMCHWMKRHPQGCHLIQISSDMVYDGIGPHTEDRVTIRNNYAFSKMAGELAASLVPSTILRINFFGRSQCAGRGSFTDWIYQALRTNTPIKVFEDVLFSPLSLPTLCTLLNLVVEKRPIGVFNLGARDGMSKADFAFAFAATLNRPSHNLQRGAAGEMPALKAKRPGDMRMDCRHFERVMQVQLPSLIDEIYLTGNEYHEST